MVKLCLINLGCARNLVDSESLLFYVKQSGFSITPDMEKAQVGIVNTCAFIDEAKQESIDVILQAVYLKKKHSLNYLIVTGCLVQRYPDQLYNQIKEIDGLVSPFYYTEIVQILGQVLKGKRVYRVGEPGAPAHFFGKRYPLTPHSYTYLKISEGCNNQCSYCIIPHIKGCYKSRSINSLLRELRYMYTLMPELKEVNLVGQDTTLYGKKRGDSLINLLQSISSYDFIKWIRILYTHPKHFNNHLISEIANNPKLTRYVDLPIQHISDKILNMMNRDVNRKEIIDLIEKIREWIPGVCIRATLIVGFPHETLDDFEQLISFVKKMRFEKLGVFIYSREEGTKAYSFSDQIKPEEKIRRFDHIMQIQQEISRENLEKFLGRELDILIDKVSKQECIGRTEFDAPEVDGQVFLCAHDCSVGQIKRVKITDTLEYDLVGKEVK